MSHEIDRRSLLRLGAVGLAVPLLANAPSALASTIGTSGNSRSAADLAADRIVASVRRPFFPPRKFPRQAGHRIKTNTLRGGYVLNTNVYRVKAATVGGPLLLIQGTYNNQTGAFPPDVSDINLTDWTVGSCAGIWSITGASASDPVGTATLDHLTITTSTAANSAVNISKLVVEDVTVGGVPVI